MEFQQQIIVGIGTLAQRAPVARQTTAALVHHYLRGAKVEKINEAANRLGAWVATQAGAMPAIPPDVLKRINED